MMFRAVVAAGAEHSTRVVGAPALALAFAALCWMTSCSRAGGKADGKSVVLAGLHLGMTEQEVDGACGKRASQQIVRRIYGGFDAKGRALPSTPTATPAAPGEQRSLTHMTCGSAAGLTDIAFSTNSGEVRAVAIRHDDHTPAEKSPEAGVKALTNEFGEPAQRAVDKIAHSGLDKLSLEWVVPKGARDCRDLLKRAEEPKLEIPSDCGFTYTTDIFSQGGAVTTTKSSLIDLGEMLRTHQRFLTELYAKQERR